MGKKGTERSAQKRSAKSQACERPAFPNYHELEVDSPAPRDGIMDARFQSPWSIVICFVSKVRTDPDPEGLLV